MFEFNFISKETSNTRETFHELAPFSRFISEEIKFSSKVGVMFSNPFSQVLNFDFFKFMFTILEVFRVVDLSRRDENVCDF